MAFEITKTDIKKSQRCPAGMHIFTITAVEDEYFNEKGTMVQKLDFESDEGYCISHWFNNKMLGSIIEMVAAADNVDPDDIDAGTLELKNYLNKKMAGSVSHGKDKANKIQAQIDNFFSTTKIPF